MLVNSLSGRIRRPSTATISPASLRTGAAANIVGTPGDRSPHSSSSNASEANGGETSGPLASTFSSISTLPDSSF